MKGKSFVAYGLCPMSFHCNPVQNRNITKNSHRSGSRHEMPAPGQVSLLITEQFSCGIEIGLALRVEFVGLVVIAFLKLLE